MSPPCKYIEFWSGERQNESHKGVVPTSFDQPPAMQTFTRDPVGIEELPFATELDKVNGSTRPGPGQGNTYIAPSENTRKRKYVQDNDHLVTTKMQKVSHNVVVFPTHAPRENTLKRKYVQDNDQLESRKRQKVSHAFVFPATVPHENTSQRKIQDTNLLESRKKQKVHLTFASTVVVRTPMVMTDLQKKRKQRMAKNKQRMALMTGFKPRTWKNEMELFEEQWLQKRQLCAKTDGPTQPVEPEQYTAPDCELTTSLPPPPVDAVVDSVVVAVVDSVVAVVDSVVAGEADDDSSHNTEDEVEATVPEEATTVPEEAATLHWRLPVQQQQQQRRRGNQQVTNARGQEQGPGTEFPSNFALADDANVEDDTFLITGSQAETGRAAGEGCDQDGAETISLFWPGEARGYAFGGKIAWIVSDNRSLFVQPSNHPTVQPSNHPTIQQSNHPTIQSSNHPTIQSSNRPQR
ncbi:predicted protein [Phaeodactylum tricornutum CCAP 1055/1]|uniref:Uncharacterized protein n=1 Tax=Phaeodactylum tricornutum (strain CCAP 1055/1) TaxID=556484 RepID=B7GAQ4_PHATC|nr:predicted protein [Phaeodactylum tricornutum CCAP 1055/1]EEC44414.1 predicted protein [Phaeodactylum tricornutum CCAP 1055/1]|eukprot:XP_002184236.1 predicted protein [Phaeodactylum tricornutum CCAP 1055/1]